MITTTKLDPRKRCLLDITSEYGGTVLHYTASHHSDPAVLELLIREHQLALCATDRKGTLPCRSTTSTTTPSRSRVESSYVCDQLVMRHVPDRTHLFMAHIEDTKLEYKLNRA